MTSSSPFERALRSTLLLLIPALILWSPAPLQAQEDPPEAAPPAVEVQPPAEPEDAVLPEEEAPEPEEEAPAPVTEPTEEEEEVEVPGWFRRTSAQIVDSADAAVAWSSDMAARVLFFDLAFNALHRERVDPDTQQVVIDPETGEPEIIEVELPLLVMVLMFGAIYFTFFFRFINLRGFKHGFDIVRGKFTKKEDVGEISPFRALTSALSATVGLGNIAGVAIAISMGGPGAMFWMVIMGFFGMSMKFTECTLALMFRKTNPDGTIAGGPMFYLDAGMRQMGSGFAAIGKVLAVAFAFMIMVGSFGGGNMFQSNQAFAILRATLEEPLAGRVDLSAAWVQVTFGLIAAIMVGIVVIGGIRRIGAVTARLVPLMAVIYVLGCLTVLVVHYRDIPGAFETIIRTAFTDNAMFGGFIGVLIIAIRRAAFSNEAGLGSSPIAHSAARNKEPVREGLVAMMEPFIDTIIICTMTALVVVITGAYLDPEVGDGIELTRAAFLSVIPWFPLVLVVCVLLFAYSTMISWCYYGERGWIYLMDLFGGVGMGVRSLLVFRLAFVFFAFVGVLIELDTLIDMMDMLILGMSFPNIIGCVILGPLLMKAVKSYWRRLEAGEFDKNNGNGGFPTAGGGKK